ncbi:glycosyltransferase family 39 protein [Streptomyces sp. NPDC048270]|uniref:glycosyltransferase family 39 protein n=1 Tax=Streptomyces sp. NPDC048270 TaxID=3154615 RepID=UPI0033C69FD7
MTAPHAHLRPGTVPGASPPFEEDRPTLALQAVDGPAPSAASVPVPPTAGWSAEGGRRRALIARGALACVLIVQTLLTLRRPAGVTPFEALSLTVGHAEATVISAGTHGPWSVPALGGSPQSFPALAAVADAAGGIWAARTVSLVLMLVTTTLLYGLATRLFNVRAGLCAAALFAVLPSTAVLGGSATPEAAGLCLLACTARAVTATGRAGRLAVLCAVPVAGAAVLTQHWTVLCLLPVVLLAGVRADDAGRFGGAAVRRVLAAAAGVAGLLWALHAAGVLTGPVFRSALGTPGVAASGPAGPGPAVLLLMAAAAVGAACHVFRDGMGEHPLLEVRRAAGRARRAAAVLALGAAAAAPLAAVAVSGSTAGGIGRVGALAWFAAPLAGVGVTWLMGRHLRFPQFAIAFWTAALCLGMPHTDRWFAAYPDQERLAGVLAPYAGSSGTYLAIPAEMPGYQLRTSTRPEQWTDCAGRMDGSRFAAADPDAACAQAVRSGEFRLIVLDGTTRPAVQKAVVTALRGNPHYQLLADLTPDAGQTGYRIWVKVTRS